MSISYEYAMEHRSAPAVLCCRTEAGTVLSEHNLEDPAIFDDLVDSGLLNLEGALSIGQVIGATLKETADSLTAISPGMVDNLQSLDDKADDKDGAQDCAGPEVSEEISVSPSYTPHAAGVLKLHIGEGKDIDIELPVSGNAAPAPTVPVQRDAVVKDTADIKEEQEEKPIVRHTLKNYDFPVKEVRLSDKTSFEDGVLTVRESLVTEAMACSDFVKDIRMDIIAPDNQDVYTDTMMDVQPIAVKKEGKLGEGTTFEMTGVVMLLTGMDEEGVQVADASASNGIYSERCVFGRPGVPNKSDYVIRVHATIQAGTNMERPGPLSAHQAMDVITQEIREVLKEKDSKDAAQERVYEDVYREGRPRVLLVKEIMGQGAMHDNLILPDEPCGFIGGRPNVDLGNVPVFLRTNEVRDGGIHALTCITPDTKETSLCYWREPIIKRLAEDTELNLIGVLFVGSPQACTEKFYVSERVGATVEAIGADGCIVTTEGFGNNHVDFASHIEQIGALDIPVVGCSYCGVSGALVVGNKYMDAMVDMCVTDDGVFSDRLGENSLSDDVALRCVAMLKDKMAGLKVNAAHKNYNPAVNSENLSMAKEVYKC